MQENSNQIITTIIIFSVFVLMLVIALFLLFKNYMKNKARLLTENELIKAKFSEALLQSQLEIQEQTFTQISEEIHDNIGQVLSLVRLNINTLGAEPAEEKINTTDELLGRAINDLRNLSHGLNTDHIREAGLAVAVEQLLLSLRKSGQFQTTFQNNWHNLPVSEEKSIILYRIIQEVINNIVKHAGAKKIEIVMANDDHHLHIEIRDNGRGFDPAILESPLEGQGIRSIRQRAKMIGAEIHFNSSVAQGTTVSIQMNSLLTIHE
jgi:signal transduction histidine kinase